MTIKPFRGRSGFDAAGNRGVNLAAPIDDTDFANKIFVEEQVAAQSRLRGTYLPDSDGQETPSPQLSSLVGGVDVLTADYWIVEVSGRSATDPFALVELNADDRVVARVSSGAVSTVTLNPATPTGLIPNNAYRFEPTDAAYTGDGQGLALLLFTDGTGTVNATAIVNPGYDYQIGDVINGFIPNTYVNAVAPTPTITPGVFQLLPNTTYYNIEVTGGTGTGFRLNIRTDGTGAGIAASYILDRGINYTAGDVLTFETQGVTLGTITVNTVVTSTDVACQVTVTNTAATGVGWDLIRGPGLTRSQADLDYLRLDGSNTPNRNISWNGQNLQDLADPILPQDAVNLRTLQGFSSAVKIYVVDALHGYSDGDPVYYDGASWRLAQADDFSKLAVGLVEVVNPDSFYVVSYGILDYGVPHGFPTGQFVYLSSGVAGQLTTTKPTLGYQQFIAEPLDANQLFIRVETAFYTGIPVI